MCPNLKMNPSLLYTRGGNPAGIIQAQSTLFADGLLPEQGQLGWLSVHLFPSLCHRLFFMHFKYYFQFRKTELN